MINWLDISTEQKKQELYELFDSMESKADIYRYFSVCDSPTNNFYLKDIAEKIGFNLNIYKERKKKYCLYCGKEITGRNRSTKKFCDNSCAARYNNRGRIHSEETKKKISESLTKHKDQEYSSDPVYCKNCGKLIEKRPNIFCNQECYTEYYKKEKIKDWQHNPDKYCSEEIPNFIRNYLIDKYGCCQLCGWNKINPTTNKMPLEVHHIDGDCTNNKEDNLQLLCPNCHSLTPNSGALNIGNSKRYKYKAYRKRLSDSTENQIVEEWK